MQLNFNAVFFILMGLIVLTTGHLSIYPGVISTLNIFKYIISFVFLTIGFYLLFPKSK